MARLHYSFHNISKSCVDGLYVLELDEVGGFGRSFVMNEESAKQLFIKLKKLMEENTVEHTIMGMKNEVKDV